MLWSCLASMSAYAKELNTAEIGYAAIQEVGMNFIVNLPWKIGKLVEIMLFASQLRYFFGVI
ncbi:hypothetical protein DPMN_133656 [Dreissena polymorpha]|uniref:IFT80/172/WDR35 TPR domain-containing protein n=1 Tax=Dreissena polymorpha TaxID=45954 RepID=A0A9D4JD41_DREPO|nr:hypothetical protein DPMN_133656 [Dreissena polymorpha]